MFDSTVKTSGASRRNNLLRHKRKYLVSKSQWLSSFQPSNCLVIASY